MGILIPRKKNKINKIDLSTISFDPETGIKNLLISRQPSPIDALNKKKPKNRVYEFFRNLMPKKQIHTSLKSFSLQSKHSKIADINDTIKNIETAFQPKRIVKSKENNTENVNQLLLKSLLLKTPKHQQKNGSSKRRDSLFPSFIRKISEFKKNKMGLNPEDLQLFNILKNYFKAHHHKKPEEKLSYELKKNKATLECLLSQQKEALDYYVDEVDLPKKRIFKEELLSLQPKSQSLEKAAEFNVNSQPSQLKNTKKSLASNMMEISSINNPNIAMKYPDIEAAFDSLKLSKKMSIPKKSFKLNASQIYHKNKSLSPSHMKNRTNPSESLLFSTKFSTPDIENPLTLKLQQLQKTNSEDEETITKKNVYLNNLNTSPSLLSKDSKTPIQNWESLTKKPSFNKIVLNKCIIPLRFKKPSLRKESVHNPEFRRRRTCFNDEISSSLFKSNLPKVMTPINEENSAHSLKNKNRPKPNQMIESSEDSSEEYAEEIATQGILNKSSNTEVQCFTLESPNVQNKKNPARIIKYGNWDPKKFFDNENLERKEKRKSRSFLKIQQEKSSSEENLKKNQGSPMVKKIMRGGKFYNLLKKNDNLIVRNNKAVQLLQEDNEFLERLKKKKWFDGLDHLGKITYKNSSPTMFYFCKNKEEQSQFLSFET